MAESTLGSTLGEEGFHRGNNGKRRHFLTCSGGSLDGETSCPQIPRRAQVEKQEAHRLPENQGSVNIWSWKNHMRIGYHNAES
ncbi:hypothetical protein Y1Q_0007128 [Alligator mississippiensis]|uniref:Uncharacterized protein n=1 Tax=Alligator mississippiensis TaxID=8496 RepID=A0A151N5T3_ALLMI|nr:hypothetical protein Y1Q_0007128 [Alligator mississippiensis]